MRIVVDSNIVFSAMLNTESRLAALILIQKPSLNFYAPQTLFAEITKHSHAIRKISGYSQSDFERVCTLFITRIRLINTNLIPKKILIDSLALTKNIDQGDAEFVALTNHIKGRLWTGDKKLSNGLKKKGWTKCISTEEIITQFKK